MVTDVGVAKRDDATAVVDGAREVKKVITVHVGSKIGPANAVGVNIWDEENRGRVDNVRDLLWS